MTYIGLLSDTHGWLDTQIFEYFKDVDEIWHAGDVGSTEIITQLRNFKPLRGVYGNIDDKKIQLELPLHNRFVIEDFDVWITHIAGYPGRYASAVRDVLKVKPPDILICGHSHILKVMRDKQYGNMLTLNPGACGVHGFHKFRTILRFKLHEKQISDMEAIELGLRGLADF
jgi:uncharacterized protein